MPGLAEATSWLHRALNLYQQIGSPYVFRVAAPLRPASIAREQESTQLTDHRTLCLNFEAV